MAMHYCCSLRSELPLARPSCVAALLASLHAAANRVAPARLVRAAVTRRRWPPCSAVSRWSPHVPRRLRRLRRGDLSPCDDLADLAGAASVSRLWCRFGPPPPLSHTRSLVAAAPRKSRRLRMPSSPHVPAGRQVGKSVDEREGRGKSRRYARRRRRRQMAGGWKVWRQPLRPHQLRHELRGGTRVTGERDRGGGGLHRRRRR